MSTSLPPPTGEGGPAIAGTDEVEAASSTRLRPPHQSALRLTASPHRGSHGFAKISMPSPGGRCPEGADEGRGAFAILLKLQSYLPVLPYPHQSRLRRASFPQGKPFGTCKYKNLPAKKVQTSKSGLHLLFAAVVLRQLAANLIPSYQAARSWMLVR